jgi:3-hydroxyisobutyrate dehydrogenase-like beta-hydroxyacid dehydrogenase
MEVGFIGLGHMGAAIARNLVKAGHRVGVHNRTRAKSETLARDGAQDGAWIAETPAEAARGGIVMTMLADDHALAEMVEGPDGALAGLQAGGVLVNLSTVSLATTRRLSGLARDAGKFYVAAPVFGRPDAAEAGKLFVLAAGPADAIAKVEPLLTAIGQKLSRFGEDPVHAAAVKIAGNFMLQSAIETLAEAIALLRAHGVDPAAFLELMTGSLFPGRVYEGYGAAIVRQRFEPAGFAIPLALKDTRLAIAAAEEVSAPLPIADLVRDRFLIALSRGWSHLDQAALGRLAAENAGLG